MLFWIICLLITCAVAAAVVIPMIRPPVGDAEDPQVALYKAQLAEVDRDVARDVLAPEEAERAKTEIARRLLAASPNAKTGAVSPITRPVAAVTVVLLVALAGGTYWVIGAPGYPDLPLKTRIALGNEARAARPSQQQAEAAAPPLAEVDVPEDYLESVAQLRAIVPQRPDDQQGWELLSFHEAQLRNYAAAADAQERVIALKDGDVTLDDLVRYADLLVAAANGYVSPEAEAVAQQILNVDQMNIAGRYYLGAMYDQTDRPDLALRLWRSILESGAEETFHIAAARAQVSNTAVRAGVDYVPPPPQEAGLDDLLAQAPEDLAARTEMIEGMVSGLADRLATQGGPVTDWARLITSYTVLGREEDARAILAEARDVFGASEDAVAVLDEAATAAGLN